MQDMTDFEYEMFLRWVDEQIAAEAAVETVYDANDLATKSAVVRAERAAHEQTGDC